MAQKEHEDQPAKPVRDDGVAPGETTPFYAGQSYQATPATRKAELLHSGSRTGFVPGHGGTLRGSTLRAGGVDEAWAAKEAPLKPGGPRPDNGIRRPMPREVPMHRQPAPGGAGSFVRYLDGHTELHRDRPGAVEYLNSLDHEDDADERGQVHAEIAQHDAYFGHRYW